MRLKLLHDHTMPFFVSPELSSERDYVITYSVCGMYGM